MSAQKDRLVSDVEFLTTIRPYRNSKNLKSLQKASSYIRDEFIKIGFEVEEQKWMVGKNEFSNVIASYNKEKSKRLIIGAHYDVAGNTPGADDNASAVAGLLETARMIQENKPEIDYRIDFVAYCLEEPPHFGKKEMGSFVHAKSLWAINADVIGMICYEMIGFFSKQGILDEYKSQVSELVEDYPDNGEYIVVVGNEDFTDFNEKVFDLMEEDSGIDVQLANLPAYHKWAGMSDHLNYWKFSYPALMINDAAFLRNPNYHRISDTIDTLNFDKMTEVVNSTYRAVINMA